MRAGGAVELEWRPHVEERGSGAVVQPAPQLVERHVFHWLTKSRSTELNRSGSSSATKCPAPGKHLEPAVEGGRREPLGVLDRDELVLVPDADEQRAAERGHDARQVEAVAHRLLRDRQVLEIGIRVRALRQPARHGAR